MKKFSFKNFSKEQKDLRLRILEITFKSGLSHLGSCFTAIDLIDGIYKIKKGNDKFILSNGHAGVAWYAILEKYGIIKDKDTVYSLNVHPDRNLKHGIHVSTGSLGQGLPIALGMALADRKTDIYCMVSDGESTEGSIWEALKVAKEKKVYNLKIIVNANGWSAYDPVDLEYLRVRLKAFGFSILEIDGHNPKEILKALKKFKTKKSQIIFAKTNVAQFPFLKGVDAHYYVLKNTDYKSAKKTLL